MRSVRTFFCSKAHYRRGGEDHENSVSGRVVFPLPVLAGKNLTGMMKKSPQLLNSQFKFRTLRIIGIML